MLPFFPGLKITQEQLESDITYIFGALQSVFCVYGKVNILHYQYTQDGIMVWHNFLNEFDHSGDQQVASYSHLAMIDTIFSSEYDGGLAQFVLDLQNAFVELEALQVHYTPQQQLDTLLRHAHTVDTNWMITYCHQQGLDFTQSCTFLCQQGQSIAWAELATSKHNSKHVVQADAALSHTPLSSGVDDLHTLLLANRSDTDVPHALWKLLPPEVQTVVIEACRQLRQSERQSSQLEGGPTGSVNSLPRQYSNSKDTRKVQFVDSAGDTGSNQDNDKDDSDPEDASEVEANARALLAALQYDPNWRVNNLTVKAHIEYEHQVKTFLTKAADGEGTAISDAGADSCVGGCGWAITSTTMHKANLVGFDDQCARKDGLTIGTAITKIVSVDPPIFVHAHEMVMNPSSWITLLSEYQIREYGCVIDSVAKHHKRSHADDDFGTQCFQPTKGITIPFEIEASLAVSRIATPTSKVLAAINSGELKCYTITGDEPWIPARYYSDPKATSILSPTGTAQHVNS